MFKKKLSFILIVMVFMLSLGVVSAIDVNSTDDVEISDVDEEPPSASVGDLSTDEVIADSDSSDGSGNYSLRGNDVDVYYKGTAKYEVILSQDGNPVNNSVVQVNVSGKIYNVTTDKNGKASVSLNSNTENYVVSAFYGNLAKVTNNVKILPVIKAKDVQKTYGSSKSYSATFLDSNGNLLKNTDVKFKLNGKTYTKKTNSKGVASIALDLKVGTYTIMAIHPNGYKISNKIVVKHSIVSSNVNKHYKSSKKFTATFYNKNGKVLAKKNIKFKYRGKTFTKKTNSKGKASLNIYAKPGTYTIYSINSNTGEKVKNTITVSSTLVAKKMTVFTGSTYKYQVKLYKNDKLSKNKKVHVYIKGKKHTAKTNSKGIATVKFKLSKGTYTFKSVDPYTGYSVKKKVTVKLASIKASSMGAVENKSATFKATLLKQSGKVAADTKMKITLNGVSHTVKTNSKGVAKVTFKLPKGSYKAVCKDLSTGYTKTVKITVVKSNAGLSYSKYGVSDDGSTILAIGRASARGELSKYGYTFYMCEFVRTCPHCGSHELYWSIFWAGNEYSDYGTFPATGLKEGSSAEGAIFCANCDADFSIFGQDHGSSAKLVSVTKVTSTTKDMAYLLKSGNYVEV